MRHLPWAFLALFFLAACGEEPFYVPKPRIYPRVDYPQRRAQALDKDFCAFNFEYMDYMKFEQDTLHGTQRTPHACWFDLKLPNFNGEVHFTYTPIGGPDLEKNLHKVFNDAYRLANEHNIKANANEDLRIYRPDAKVYGVLFNIEGHVASPFQFVLTDSSRHALRASLYFRNAPNPDSMLPVIDFVKTDIMHMINTFSWK